MDKLTKNKIHRLQYLDFIGNILSDLKELKKQKRQFDFNKLMEKALPNVKRYFSLHLARALKDKSVPEGKYKVADLVDELYIMAYDHIHEVKEDKYLYGWLFKKAEELMEDIVIEEDFDQAFYENIDNYSKLEWDEMEEQFSTDGDGDLVMEEELDDLSYPKNEYTLKDVFIEDNQEVLIEKINKELNEEKIKRTVNVVLSRLPLMLRTIFDLSAIYKFELHEIAEIKKLELHEVEKGLAEVREYLRKSLRANLLLNTGFES